jgi:hypothetical protein
MTTLLQYQNVPPANGFAAERKTGRACPVTDVMLRPAREAGKALSMPRCSEFAAFWRAKPPKPAIYRAISRLEPGCNLGQKGALPARLGGGLRLVARYEVLDGAVAERLKAAVC